MNTINEIDSAVIAAIATGESDDAVVDRLSSEVAEGLAMSAQGWGKVSPNYIPSQNFTLPQKIARGQRVFIRSRMLALAEANLIHWEYDAARNHGQYVKGKA